jgi:hypothetical protein
MSTTPSIAGAHSFVAVAKALRPARAPRALVALLVVSCLAFLCAVPLEAWNGSNKAVFIGGTLPGMPDSAKGTIDTTDEDAFVFDSKSVEVEIPWDKINMLEYGQRAGRRIGLAIAVSPMFLSSKSRKHFLTMSFIDERDRQQALVFQIDKRHVRSVLVTMEARTGLRIEFQDNAARFGGEAY